MIDSASEPRPRPTFRDRLRTETYFTRLDWHLEAVLPGKERRATIKELRQALTGDPRGVTAALSDLGHPKTLARQYAADGGRRPLWSIGIITAATALLVYWMVFLSFAFGMLSVVDANQPMEAETRIFFVEVLAYSSADAMGIGWTSTWAWLAVPGVIIMIALLAGARSWRLLGRRRTG